MINTNKYRDMATELNTSAKITVENLSNSKLSEVSLEESSKVCGGMFTLVNRTLVKKQQPMLQPGIVFQPNERDRRRLCAIDPRYC